MGDNCMNFNQPILPKGQKRRSKGLEKSGFELNCKSGGPEFKSHQRRKKLSFRFNVSCVQSLIAKQFNLKCDVQL